MSPPSFWSLPLLCHRLGTYWGIWGSVTSSLPSKKEDTALITSIALPLTSLLEGLGPTFPAPVPVRPPETREVLLQVNGAVLPWENQILEEQSYSDFRGTKRKSLGLQGGSNQSILKESSPEYSWKD